LALYGHGFGVTSYRLTIRENGKSRPIFAGTVKTDDRTDWIEIAGEIIKAVCVRPGDVPGETSLELTPEQLAVVLHHGLALRAAAAKRFGWTPAEARPLRSDLPVQLTHRATQGGKRLYHARAGVIQTEGHTRQSALQAMREAIANHVSAVPVFRATPDLTRVIAMYPVGSQFDAVELHPGKADPVGTKYHLKAHNLTEAMTALEGIIKPRPRARSGTFSRVTLSPPRARVGKARA
jgi:hypothetical protein